MKKRIGILAAGCMAAAGAATGDLKPVSIREEFGGGRGQYTYAPSPVELKDGTQLVFFCQNENPFTVIDSIFLAEGKTPPGGKQLRWKRPKLVLSPPKRGWDNVHICDPDVRMLAGVYNGKSFSWVMTYLGVAQKDCNNNEIGLAFAKTPAGPWTKFDANPIVKAPDPAYWGAGQTSSIVTGEASMDMYYTKATAQGSRVYRRSVDFQKDGTVKIGEEAMIPGLRRNASVARSEKFYYAAMPLEGHAPGTEPPVSKSLALVRIPASEDITNPSARWEEIGQITPQDTNSPRNHNAGLLTDPRGWIKDDNTITVYFSVGKEGDGWLWTYTLYSALFKPQSP